jgi:hypothetical protein
MNRPFPLRIAALCGTACLLSLSACRKPEIRVYTISKELAEATPPPIPAQPGKGGEKGGETREEKSASRPRPQLDYKLPAGWQDAGPNQFSLVNFRIPTPSGEATVNITPLAGMAGKDAVIVNLWRSQVGEPPLEEADATANLSPVEVGGEQGKLFEITGKREGGAMEILTAFVHRPDGSWFYKLQGSPEAVASQRQAFLDFLKTIKIKSAPAAETAGAHAPAPTPAPEPTPPVHLVAPEGWRQQTAGAMQVAKFTVAKDSGKADISVSVFPSDTGGTLGNVNRWRKQLGLEEIDENGLSECVTPLGGAHIDGAPGPVLVDLANENRRLLGAIVPRESQYWFYKMVGDAPVVNAEHDAFVQFVKSQP